MRIAGLLLVLAAAAAGADERLTYTAKDRPLREVVARLNEHFGFELRLGGGLSARPVTLELKDATAPQALRALADAAGQPMTRLGRGRYLLGIDDRERIRKALDTTALPATFGTRMSHLCTWIRNRTGVNARLDGGVDARAVVLQGRQSVAEALNAAMKSNGLAWDVRWGCVFIAKPERLDKLPKHNPFSGIGLPDERIDFIHKGSLQALTVNLAKQVNLKVDPKDEILPSRLVTLDVRNVLLSDALAMALVPHGYAIEKRGKGFVIVDPRNRRLDYAAKDTPLRDVVAKVSAFFGIEIEVAETLAARKVTMTFTRATSPQVLRKLADTLGVELKRRGEGRFQLGEPDVAMINEILDGNKITFSIRGVEMHEVVGVLHKTSSLPLALDRALTGKVDLTLNNVTLRQTLALLLEPRGAAHVVRCGFLCLGPPERLARYPVAPLALERPGKAFGVTLNRITLGTALKTLRAGSGIRIRFDETVPPKFRDVPVTLHAKKTTLGAALAVILVPIGHTVEETKDGLVVKAAAK